MIDEGVVRQFDDVVELQVEPSSIDLNSPDSYSQIVVSAKYANGQVCDVTRLTKFQSSGPEFTVSEFGLVRPKQPGNGNLSVVFGGTTDPATPDDCRRLVRDF